MSLCIRDRPGLLGLHALTLASPGPPSLPPDFWALRAREEQGGGSSARHSANQTIQTCC